MLKFCVSIFIFVTYCVFTLLRNISVSFFWNSPRALLYYYYLYSITQLLKSSYQYRYRYKTCSGRLFTKFTDTVNIFIQ